VPYIILILICKFFAHTNEVEFLTLNSLFGAIISATVFLVGFLISGVLADYKESEKLPGDLACSLETITDECHILLKNKKHTISKKLLEHIHTLTESILNWFHKREKTTEIQRQITELNMYFLALEPLTQANFIVRLKNEQHAIRRLITRIHSVRETTFNSTGYAITEITTFVLCLGLIFTKLDPFFESIFFVTFISFILIYMVLLIKELDNPFGYYEKRNYADEISLHQLYDLEKRLSNY